jgi:hypothetical protein
MFGFILRENKYFIGFCNSLISYYRFADRQEAWLLILGLMVLNREGGLVQLGTGRMEIEHKLGELKIYKIIQQTYRNFQKKHYTSINIIAGLANLKHRL